MLLVQELHFGYKQFELCNHGFENILKVSNLFL